MFIYLKTTERKIILSPIQLNTKGNDCEDYEYLDHNDTFDSYDDFINKTNVRNKYGNEVIDAALKEMVKYLPPAHADALLNYKHPIYLWFDEASNADDIHTGNNILECIAGIEADVGNTAEDIADSLEEYYEPYAKNDTLEESAIREILNQMEDEVTYGYISYDKIEIFEPVGSKTKPCARKAHIAELP